MITLSLSHYTYVRSGYINAYDNTLRFAGVYGYSWPQMSHSDVRFAYRLFFNTLGVDPSDVDGRSLAFPVRQKLT